VEVEHVGEPERAVVVLDHQPAAPRLPHGLQPALEALEGRVASPGQAADVQHDHRLGTAPEAVQQPRHHVQLAGGQRPDLGPLGVQDDVLAGMERQPHVQLAGARPDARELLGALVHLPVEAGELRVGGIRRERRRHPVHAHVDRVQALEDRLQAGQRDRQVRLGLPPARVV
jgi:hypothetical protein